MTVWNPKTSRKKMKSESFWRGERVLQLYMPGQFPMPKKKCPKQKIVLVLAIKNFNYQHYKPKTIERLTHTSICIFNRIKKSSLVLVLFLGAVRIQIIVPVTLGMAIGNTVAIRVDLAVRSAVLAALRRLRLQIGVVEEVEEENKVREVHEKGPHDVFVRDVALIAAPLLEVGDRVDNDADDHLGDLPAGDHDVDPLWDSEAEGAEAVVRVHGSVDGEVHEDKPATGGAEVLARVPAVDEDSCVVVPAMTNKINENY